VLSDKKVLGVYKLVCVTTENNGYHSDFTWKIIIPGENYKHSLGIIIVLIKSLAEVNRNKSYIGAVFGI